jgi:hypothetical protein
MKQGFSRAAGADFFREVEIDYNCVAALLLSLLPKDKKLRPDYWTKLTKAMEGMLGESEKPTRYLLIAFGQI